MTAAEPGPGLRAARTCGEALQLVLDNDLAAIESGRRKICEWLDPMKLSPKATHRWEVVFEEIVSNIVRHGFSPGSRHTVFVQAARTPNTIDFTFDDDGRPFDPLTAPAPQPLRSLETAPLGGLGVALVRRLAAAMSYERDPETATGGTSTDLTFTPRNRLRVSIATGE
ncbi:MAG: ATP-binding protein [Caulobacteraceae bacterium]|nr:ATP-binding protein [Caulobacteraceae bacterium]